MSAPVRVRRLALDREAAAGERAADALERRRLLVEAHAPAEALDAVGEAAHAQARALELERAGDTRRRARAAHVDGEPGRPAAAQAPRHERRRAQVGLPPRRDRERAVADEVGAPGHDEVGALAGEVEAPDVQPPVRVGEAHRLARTARELGQEDLQLRQRRLGPHLGRPRERPADPRLAGRHDRERGRQRRLHDAHERVDAGGAGGQREVGLVRRVGADASREREVDTRASGSARRSRRGRRPLPTSRASSAPMPSSPTNSRGEREARDEPRPRERALQHRAAGQPAAVARRRPPARARARRGRRPPSRRSRRRRRRRSASRGSARGRRPRSASPAVTSATRGPPARGDRARVVRHALVPPVARGEARLALGCAAPAARTSVSPLAVPLAVTFHSMKRTRSSTGQPSIRARPSSASFWPNQPISRAAVPRQLGPSPLRRTSECDSTASRRGVERARPLRAAPVDAGVDDVAAGEAALEDRPVDACRASGRRTSRCRRSPRAAPRRCRAPGAAARAARRRRRCRRSRLDREVGAVLRVDAARSRCACRPGPCSSTRSKLCAPSQRRPVDAAGDGEAAVGALGEVDGHAPADARGPRRAAS